MMACNGEFLVTNSSAGTVDRDDGQSYDFKGAGSGLIGDLGTGAPLTDPIGVVPSFAEQRALESGPMRALRWILPLFAVLTASCTQDASSPTDQSKTGAEVANGCVASLGRYRDVWFTDSGDRLVVQGDRGIAVFDTATWQSVPPCTQGVQAVSTDARTVAVRTEAGSVEVGPLGGPFVAAIPAAQAGGLSFVGFGPDAAVLAVIRDRNKPGQTLELWKSGTAAPPWSRPIAPNNISAPAWSKDRRWLAISNGKASVSIVDVAGGKAIEIPVSEAPRRMMFSLDGSRLAVALGKTIGVYEARSGRAVTQVTLPNNRSAMRPIAFGSALLVTDYDMSFASFDPATGAMRSNFVLHRQPRRNASAAEKLESVKSWASAASGDGSLLVVHPEGDYNLVLFDAGAGRQAMVLSPLYTYGQRPAIAAMAMSPAKDLVVVGIDTGDLRTWSLVGKGSTILHAPAR